MDGPISPRRGISEASVASVANLQKPPKNKKKMKDTIKVMFKTEKRKKDKSKQGVTKNVKLLSEFIKNNSLKLEGIMRVSGNQNEVKKLKALLDSGEPVNLIEIVDHNIISGAFKMYFREMSEPLLTLDLYKNFLGANDIKDAHAKTSFLKALVITLPPFNSELFMELLQVLYKIQQHAAVNRMTSDNLAIVFAPTILRPREETVDTMMGDAAACASVVQFMIDNCKALYPETQIALPVLTTIVSEDVKGGPKSPTAEKSMDKIFEESLEKLNKAMQSQANEARERAVWESYAQSLQLKLDEVDDNFKVLREERDGLLDVVKDIRVSRAALEEQVAALEKRVEVIPKLKEEAAALKAERDAAMEEKIKHMTALGASNSDTQKQITLLQEEFTKVKHSHEAELKALQEQIAKITKEKKDSEDKFTRESKSLREEVKRLEQTSGQQLGELQKLREKEKQVGAREQELTKQVDGLRGQVKQAVQDLDSKSQEATQLKRDKLDLEAKLRTQTNEVNTLKKKLETDGGAKDGKLAETQKQVTEQQKQNADKQKLISDLQINVTDLQKQVESMKTENSRLQKEKQLPPLPASSPARSSSSAAVGNVEVDQLKQQLDKEKKSHQDLLDKEKKALQDQLDKEKKTHQDHLEKEKKSYKDSLEKEKKFQEDLKKELDAKTEEEFQQFSLPTTPSFPPNGKRRRRRSRKVERLKKQSNGKDAKAAASTWKASAPTISKASGSSPVPQQALLDTNVVEDLKQHLFTWLTLALKFDRMAMRKLCNINASILYEKITEMKVHYGDWPDFIRAEMDKCTIDM